MATRNTRSRQRFNPYHEKESQAKVDVNEEFVSRALDLPGEDHEILLLDGPAMQTSQMCIAAGIDPNRITVVERDESTFEIQRAKKLGIKHVFGDFFRYLDRATNWQRRVAHRVEFPTIIFADLMGSSILYRDDNLQTLANWRAKADSLYATTRREFMLVCTVCCRNKVPLSPLSLMEVSDEKLTCSLPLELRMNMLYEALCTDRQSQFSPMRTRNGSKPNVSFGLEWFHGYRRDASSATMYMPWMRSNPPDHPLVTPRKFARRRDGTVDVYYYDSKVPVREDESSDAMRILKASR